MMIIFQMAAIFFAAVTTENIFFARALDTIQLREITKSPRKILTFGAVLTSILLVSSIFLAFIDQWIRIYPLYYYIASSVYLIVNGGVYIGAYLGIKKYIPTLFQKIGGILPLASANCAVMGSLLIAARSSALTTWWKFIVYNLGSGVGFVLALLLLSSVERKLAYCKPPKAFSGLPLRLITVGIISLAIAGLVGNQLAA